MITKSERRAGRTKKAAAKPLQEHSPQATNGNETALSTQEVLRRLYFLMLKCRKLSERAQHLAASRDPAVDYDFVIGHEAIVVGATFELGQQDTIAASSRNFAAHVVKGARLEALLANGPQENGSQPGALTLLDPLNLGTGLALAHRLEKKRNAVVALCSRGDAASQDCWLEAMKFAGIHKLPIIYVLMSGPAFEPAPEKQNLALEELSFIARDCGFPAIIVDGKDAVAVWRVAQESIHRARNGAGPTLVECDTESSPSSDTLAHLEHYMSKRGLWGEEWRRDAADRIDAEIAEAASAFNRK
ncbi:MAG: thiamine pyrophosphate-dependent enzyme [Candidatus Korobacteraceae bacterium]